MKKIMFPLTLGLLLLSCGNSGPRQAEATEKSESTFSLVELWRSDTVLNTCESVLYSEFRDRLFVSCINGLPTDKNGTGYISLVKTDGSIDVLKWVEGLNAPKGMGIQGDLLYVTDIDQLVIIDISAAEIVEKLDIEGASFLNDVAVGPSGEIYFTDSNNGIIWIYKQGKPEAWITEGLEGPNGLYIEESRVLLTSSDSEDLKIIDRSTGRIETVTEGIGTGDGIEFTGMEGHYICTSWSGEVFLVFPDFHKLSLLKTSDQEINSADIGYNLKDKILYVPTFFDNRVVAYELVRSE